MCRGSLDKELFHLLVAFLGWWQETNISLAEELITLFFGEMMDLANAKFVNFPECVCILMVIRFHFYFDCLNKKKFRTSLHHVLRPVHILIG